MLAALLLLCMVKSAAAASGVEFSIPRQSADKALVEFAKQANLSVLFPKERISQYQTNALFGTYSVDEALAMLLRDTGLSAELGSNSVMTIKLKNTAGDSDMQSTTHRSWLATFFSTLAAALSTHTANAQTDAAAGPVLEEIIVTAQKRTEKVEDIPKTVDVVTADELNKAGITQLSGLSAVVPSLQGGVTGNMPGQRSLAMRGISTLPISQNLQSQVGIVLDDVPQPTWASLANELSDVERVEVLPGPQSTLSGRNAAAGLVNIVTRSPSKDWTASFGAEQTSDRQTRANGFLSGPLSDSFAFSVSLFENRWDGNVHNIKMDDWLNGQNTGGGRVKLLWNATDKLQVGLSYFVQQTSAATVGGQSTTGAASSGAIVYADPASKVLSRFDTTPAANQLTIGALEPGVTIGPDNNAYVSDRHSSAYAHDSGGSLRIDYDFDFATLSSISSYAASNNNVTGDFVAINVPVAPSDRFFHQSGISDNTVQELRLRSIDEGPFTYLVGAIYTDVKVKYNYQRAIAPVDWYRESETKSTAAYARATWHFASNTSLTGGARYQSDKLSYDWLFRPTYSAPPSVNPNSGDTTYSFASGEVSLQQKFGDNLMAYITAARGESGKAYDTEDNATTATGAQLKALDSEKVDNVEIGFKSNWLQRRLLLDLNVFYTKFDNFPVQTIFIDPNNASAAPVFKTLASGGARTEGVEFSATALPLETLRLNATAAYINAEFTDFPNAPCYKAQTVAQGCVTGPGGSAVQANLSGQQLPYSPRWKFNATADQTIKTASLPFDFDFTAFYKYQSSVQYDPLGNPLTLQGGFGILNLSGGLRDKDAKWSADLYVNNVFNKHSYQSLVDSQFWTGHVIVANLSRDWERYAGLRVQARF